MDDVETVLRVSVATALQAQQEGIARLTRTKAELREQAALTIGRARAMTDCLMEAGIFPAVPMRNESD